MNKLIYISISVFLLFMVGCAQQAATTQPATPPPPPPPPEVAKEEVKEEAKKEVKEEVKKEPVPAPLEFKIVYFDFDRSEIKPEFEGVIKGNAKVLMDNPGAKVVIEGHCDERGTNEYNMALGERRAQAVREALIAAGVTAGQVSTISRGEEEPAASGHDESAWSQNRRSVVVKAE